MVTLSMLLRSFSSRAQNGQSASENTASLRSPLPFTFFIASSSGRLANEIRLSSRCRSSVRLRLVSAS